MSFYSYDIFDTIVTRCTDSPTGIFVLVQKLLQNETNIDGSFFFKCSKKKMWKHFLDSFVSYRLVAEERIKEIASREGREEVTIADIYEEIQKNASLNKETAKTIMELEIQTEKNCLVPIRENLEALKTIIANGDRVVLISDMYLGEKILRPILTALDPVFREIPIYVSCDYDRSKQSGALYRFVRREEGISYNDWFHVGDNEIADSVVPQLLGIKTNYFKNPKKSPRLRYYETYMNEKDAEFQLMTGVLKTAPFQNELERIGGEIGGPVVFSYLRWVLDSCLDRGIKNLYFLARDGFVLKKVGDLIIDAEQMPLRTHYLYSSRDTFRIKNDEKKIQILLSYAEQEIDFFDSHPAFIDIRGTGQTMNFFFEIIKNKYDCNPVAFYHTMYASMGSQFGEFVSYTHGDFGDAVEVICRAPEGKCVGFKRDNENRIIPVMEKDDTNWEDVGLNKFNKGIFLFAEEYERMLNVLHMTHTGSSMQRLAVRYYEAEKDKVLDDYTGDFPFEVNKTGRKVGFAEKITANRAKKDYLYGITHEGHAGFLPVCLLRTSPEVKQIIHKYKDLSYELTDEEKKQYPYAIRFMEEKKRVVIYGAGKWGTKVYRALQISNGYELIAWTDTFYSQKNVDILVSPAEALKKPHDLLIIAVDKGERGRRLKELLEEVGEKNIVFAEDVLEVAAKREI